MTVALRKLGLSPATKVLDLAMRSAAARQISTPTVPCTTDDLNNLGMCRFPGTSERPRCPSLPAGRILRRRQPLQ
jgi:hypothetical protein